MCHDIPQLQWLLHDRPRLAKYQDKTQCWCLLCMLHICQSFGTSGNLDHTNISEYLGYQFFLGIFGYSWISLISFLPTGELIWNRVHVWISKWTSNHIHGYPFRYLLYLYISQKYTLDICTYLLVISIGYSIYVSTVIHLYIHMDIYMYPNKSRFIHNIISIQISKTDINMHVQTDVWLLISGNFTFIFLSWQPQSKSGMFLEMSQPSMPCCTPPLRAKYQFHMLIFAGPAGPPKGNKALRPSTGCRPRGEKRWLESTFAGYAWNHTSPISWRRSNSVQMNCKP